MAFVGHRPAKYFKMPFIQHFCHYLKTAEDRGDANTVVFADILDQIDQPGDPMQIEPYDDLLLNLPDQGGVKSWADRMEEEVEPVNLNDEKDVAPPPINNSMQLPGVYLRVPVSGAL